MKIATYNIWNSSRGMPKRKDQLVKEIAKIDADVIGLQEVTLEMYHFLKKELKNYADSYFYEFDTEYKGLAIFSKFIILESDFFENAVVITLSYNSDIYAVVNVHLPWDSVLERERLIVKLLKDIKNISSDYLFILGDFNDFNGLDNSSIHHYLTGQKTLNNTEAEPYFYDLAEIHAEFIKESPKKTLDLRSNPRWQGKKYAATSGRVDRIYYKEPFPKPFPLLNSVKIFGTDIDKDSGYCASDHYGIIVDMTFENNI